MSRRLNPNIALPQTIEWLGLKLKVPQEWEVVRHSLAVEHGRLSMVDRRQQRLELVWTQCRNDPDIDLMVQNESSRQRERDRSAAVTIVQRRGGWKGVRIRDEEGVATTRLVRFDARTNRLVEAILPSSGAACHDDFVQKAVLDNIRVVCAASEARAWCAFGLRLTTPPGFRLISVLAKPADTSFRFGQLTNRGTLGSERVTIRRMGMADSWFAGDMQRLVRRHAPKVEFGAFTPHQLCGHAATRAKGEEPGPRIARWLGRGRQRRVLLWRCDPENAVFEVSCSERSKCPISLAQFEVHCCTAAIHVQGSSRFD